MGLREFVLQTVLLAPWEQVCVETETGLRSFGFITAGLQTARKTITQQKQRQAHMVRCSASLMRTERDRRGGERVTTAMLADTYQVNYI